MSISQWFQQLSRRWRPTSRDHPEQPIRLELLLALRNLRPEQFSRYRAGVGQTLMVEVCFATLDRYVRAMQEAYLVVRDDRLVDPLAFPRETFRISLDRFLTSSDGYYLPAQPTVEKFKQVATQLCEALEASDYVAYGPAEHNLRMLRLTLLNAKELTAVLCSAGAAS